MIGKIVTLEDHYGLVAPFHQHPLSLTLRDLQKSSVIAIAEHFMVKIDTVIARRLEIRDEDAVAHILEAGAGIISLIFKDTTKNRGQQEISQNPIDQDYGV
jgi:hypothetical protein